MEIQKKKSFLDKFQGKKNIISKEGLLHLLEKKKLFNENLPQKNVQKQQIFTSNRSKQIFDHLKSNKSQRQHNKVHSLNREEFVKDTQQLIKRHKQRYARDNTSSSIQKLQQYGRNNIKLPSINKSSSHSSKIKRNSEYQLNAEIPTLSASPKFKKSYKKIDSLQQFNMGNISKKFQLDHQALRHLEFLERFQKKLIQNERSTKRSQNFSHK